MCAAILPTTRIVPIAFQARKGYVAIGEQRGSPLHVGVDESFDGRGGIVGDHGEANAPGTRVEIFGVFASRFGLAGVALDHLDGPYDEDFSGVAALKESITFAEGDFRLIDFNDAFQRLAIRIKHRAPELLRQQPRSLVGDAKLVLQLQRRHAVGMGRHEMGRPEPRRQRQPGSMHRRAGGVRMEVRGWRRGFPQSRRKSPEFYSSQSEKLRTFAGETQKVGRNDPCACGSGGKFKKCCGATRGAIWGVRPPPRLRLEPEAAR